MPDIHAPTRGILVALALGLVFWCAVGAVVLL